MERENVTTPNKALRSWWEQPITVNSWHAQIAALKFMVYGLIACHPEPVKVAAAVRSLLAEMQVQAVPNGASEHFQTMRTVLTPYLEQLDAGAGREPT